MYVMFSLSVAMGFGMLVLLRPFGGDHEYSIDPLAFSCKGCPTTTAVSFPAKALIFGRTVTSTVSREGLGHPNTSVAVSMYRVVVSGNASGESVLALISVLAGLQVNDDAM